MKKLIITTFAADMKSSDIQDVIDATWPNVKDGNYTGFSGEVRLIQVVERRDGSLWFFSEIEIPDVGG